VTTSSRLLVQTPEADNTRVADSECTDPATHVQQTGNTAAAGTGKGYIRLARIILPFTFPSHNSYMTGAGFITVGKHVYLRPGQRDVDISAAHTATKGPTVILIFGWMSAQLPHLHKYTQYYSDVYPQATQILVRIPAAFFLNTEKTNESLLAPAVEELEAAGCIAPSKSGGFVDVKEPPRILVHAFSNGGGSGLVALGRVLSRFTPSQRLTSVIVLDSCPAAGDLSSVVKAFTSSIRSTLLRAVVIFFVFLTFCYQTLRHLFFSIPHTLDALNDSLLDPHVLPWVDKRTPRLYIFSKNDELVPWQKVMAHAEKAKELGMDVRMRVYEHTSHVAHMRADPETYWSAIGQAWGDAWRADETEAVVKN